MRPATLARLAVAGTKTDTVRIALTTLASAMAVLAWLCAATVASLGFAGGHVGSAAYDLRYRSDLLQQPGLRPGVVTVFILLTVPVLGFAGQCARLGAPARDRRLAALRLAGATPRQAVALAAAETGVAAIAGSALGLGVYLIGRSLLDHPDVNGQLGLPVDVLPPIWSIVLICAGLPLVAGLAAAWLMRKVIITPLGVARRVRRQGSPKPWPAVLLVLAIVIFGGFGPGIQYAEDHQWHGPAWLSGMWVVDVTLFVGAAAAMLGVCLSAGWIAYNGGRLLRRFGGSASMQLAGARLMDDPWSGSRNMAVILIATVFGGGTAAYFSYIVTQNRVTIAESIASNPGTTEADFASGSDNSFYLNTLKLISIAIALAVIIAALGQLVSVVEGMVARRRTYASLVATGVPRSTLVRTALWQSMGVATPAVVLGVAIGVAMMRLFGGTSISGSDYDGTRKFTASVPIPWPQIGLAVGVALGAVLLTTVIGMLFIRASTSVEELRTT